MYTYHNFCWLAFDERGDFEDICEYVVEDVIPDLIIGEMYSIVERDSSPIDSIEDAIMSLIHKYRIFVVDTLNHDRIDDPYPIMFCANNTFTEWDEETQQDVEIIIKSLDDYKRLVTLHTEEVYNDPDCFGPHSDAYAWLMRGGGALDA